ncbi:hypothetical protein ACFQ2C_06295 [Sphingobacterium daejeonense]|uniref:Fimbrillin-A associated anchor proteins Mfa1 and Mfa2 n=1 Tax=Sphingobacterium daejeonense TaxID=371142 RepID=A0ABW3RJV5_9SPHI
MKKSIIILALLPLLFFGCKKGGSTDEPKPEEKLYDVKFSVSPFSQSVEPMSIKSSTQQTNSKSLNVANLFRTLSYNLTDANGKYVTSGDITIFDAWNNFITGSLDFSLKLPKGHYKIGLLGDENSGPYSHSWEEIYFNLNQQHKFASDIVKFSVETDLSIPSITLNRISSQIEFEFTDQTSEENLNIKLSGKVINNIFPFTKLVVENNIGTTIKSWKHPFNVTGHKENVIVFADLAKDATVINLQAEIYNRDNVLIGRKEIPNVTIKPNHITRLKGKLFDILESNEKVNTFKAEIVEAFSPDIINQTF